MSDSSAPPPDGEDRDLRSPAEETERRRRLARVFGEVLPDDTGDERAGAWGEPERGTGADEWLRGQVPPHHG